MYQLLDSIIEMRSSDRPCSHGCHPIAEAALVIENGRRRHWTGNTSLSDAFRNDLAWSRTVRRIDHRFVRAREEVKPERTS